MKKYYALPFLALLLTTLACVCTSTSGTGLNTPAPGATKAPAPEFDVFLKNYQEMTDAQWENFEETVVGSQIPGWEGTVTQVDKSEILDTYTVVVDMPGDGLGSEVYISADEETALSIPKDASVRFSGEIFSASNSLGLAISVRNAVIEVIE